MGIDDEKVKNLKYIIDKTGAEIVLTSSWRMSEIADILKEIGDERLEESWSLGTIWNPMNF